MPPSPPLNLDAQRAALRDVPDFPKPGIVFKDITPLLSDPRHFRALTAAFVEALAGEPIDKVAGIDARGFLFGAWLAEALGCGFVPVRKKGKLPWKSVSRAYELEYGTAEVELHQDAVQEGERVVLIDDLLATGGTAAAAAALIQELGGQLAALAFVIELGFLEGRQKLPPAPVVSLLRY
ncbi:MAG: adenine phosphoribosyltransferase [Verrucomicrobiota bacterium]